MNDNLKKLKLAKKQNTLTNEAIRSIQPVGGPFTDDVFSFTFSKNDTEAVWCIRAVLMVAKAAGLKLSQSSVRLGMTANSLILDLRV